MAETNEVVKERRFGPDAKPPVVTQEGGARYATSVRAAAEQMIRECIGTGTQARYLSGRRERKLVVMMVRILTRASKWQGELRRSREDVRRLKEEQAELEARIKEIEPELADYEDSFELYARATRALTEAYVDAHPQQATNLLPDTTRVNVWAARQLRELQETVVKLQVEAIRRDDQLEKALKRLQIDDTAIVADVCEVCGAHVGYGVRALHLGRCDQHPREARQ